MTPRSFVQLSNAVTNFPANSAFLPTKLAATGVSPASPTVGQPFSVTAQAQQFDGTPATVSGATGVSLTLATGTGTLGGTTTGTISAGTNSVTIPNVTYSKPESGVSLTATRTSGDSLTAGTSATFTVGGKLWTGATSTAWNTASNWSPSVRRTRTTSSSRPD